MKKCTVTLQKGKIVQPCNDLSVHIAGSTWYFKFDGYITVFADPNLPARGCITVAQDTVLPYGATNMNPDDEVTISWAENKSEQLYGALKERLARLSNQYLAELSTKVYQIYALVLSDYIIKISNQGGN